MMHKGAKRKGGSVAAIQMESFNLSGTGLLEMGDNAKGEIEGMIDDAMCEIAEIISRKCRYTMAVKIIVTEWK